jgi:hypothetical protein
MISWDGAQSPNRYSAEGRVWPGKIILSRASFIMIFLSSSNDKEVDVKRDGQGKGAGRVCGAGPTVSEDAGLWHAYAKALEKGAEVLVSAAALCAVREFMKCAAGRLETRTGREPSAPGFVDVANLSVLRCK